MSSQPPPVPPEQRNPHETAVAREHPRTEAERNARLNRNLGEQGRQGNIKQNTTNQGHQQDR